MATTTGGARPAETPVDQPRAVGTVERLGAVAVGLILLALFLAFAEGSFNNYRVQLVTLVAINAIVAVSLTLTSGFTGVFSLGQIGFMAIGAYVSALMTLPPQWKSPRLLPDLPAWLATMDLSGWPGWLALLVACVAGGAVAALVAAVVGAPLMRLSGHYVAVATMGFLIIVHEVANNWDTVTRGARGLAQVPRHTDLWLAYAWAVVTIYTVLRLRSSPYGRAMIASRENVIAARAIGVDVLRVRLVAFVVGAFFTGVAGALVAHQIGNVNPSGFYFTTTFAIIIMVVVGGLGSVSGAVVGATVLTLAPEYLRDVEDGMDLGPFSFGALYGLSNIILAVAFVLVTIFRPRGLFGDRELGLGILSRWRRGGCEPATSAAVDTPALAPDVAAPPRDDHAETR